MSSRSRPTSAGRTRPDSSSSRPDSARSRPDSGRSRPTATAPTSASSSSSSRKGGKSSGAVADKPRLEIDYVHGYRGARCRNNLFSLSSGEIVYHTAAMGVVMNPKDGTQRYMRGAHTDDIISLSMHPDGRTVATGQVGKNPRVVVWDTETMRPISVLQGFHERGICALDFDADGQRLFTIGLDDNHSVAVWDWRSGHRLMHARGHGDRIFEAQYNPQGGVCVTVGVKHVAFWTFENNVLTKKKGRFGRVGPLQTMLCVANGPDGTTYTGSLGGDVYIWNGTELARVIKGAHKGPIYAMWEYDQGFLTSGKDGVLRFWDRMFKPLDSVDLGAAGGAPGAAKPGSLHTGLSSDGATAPAPRAITRHAATGKIYLGCLSSDILELDERSRAVTRIHEAHGEGETWGLATHPRDQRFATGSDDGTVRLWAENLTKGAGSGGKWAMTATRPVGHPVRSVAYSPDASHVAAGCDDGTLLVLDERTLETVFEVKHCRESIGDVRYSPDGKVLAAASHDNYIDLYDVRNKYQRIGRCKGHSSYVTHIDWSQDSRVLVSESGDYERLYWDGTNAKRITRTPPGLEPDPKSGQHGFASWTGVLGDDVEGIWPKYSDKTDVNATHASSDGKTLATGDDFGCVKLFTWPPNNPGAKHQLHKGHSAHVTNVRFTAGDKHLISCGGGDQTVVVWSYSGSGGDSATESDDEMDMDLEEVDSELEEELSRQYVLKPTREEIQARKRLSAAQDNLKKRLQRRMAAPTSAANGGAESSSGSEEDRAELANAARELAIAGAVGSSVAHAEDPDDAMRIKAAISGASVPAGIATSAPVREVAVHSRRRRGGGGSGGRRSRGGGGGGTSSAVSRGASSQRRKRHGTTLKPTGEKPSETLQLDFVHGYRGHDTRDNLFYNADGHVVYHAAATGIVMDPRSRKQRFFHGHDDDIVSLAVHPDRRIVATGQIGKDPLVCVWDSKTLEPLGQLKGFHKRAVSALTFSPDGKYLVTVGRDDSNSIAVYDWNKGYLIAHAKGHSDKIVGVEWDPQDPQQFVTCGVKHISFWTIMGNTLEKKKGLFGRKAKLQTLLSCAYTQDRGDAVTYVGTASGDIYRFDGRKVDGIVPDAHKGCVFSIQPSDAGFVSGGKDGNVCLWDPGFKLLKRLQVKDELGKPVSIRSVDWAHGKILVGTSGSEIFEIDEATGKVTNLMQGHGKGELWGLAMHPTEPRMATSSMDSTLRVWDLKQQRMVKRVHIGKQAVSAAYHPDGSVIAVGLTNGGVAVFRSDTLEEVTKFRHRKEKIAAMAFSPDGRVLAVGSNDNFVDLYKWDAHERSFRRYAVCKGHSSFIVNLDWSACGKYLRTNCGAHENLYWHSANGKHLTKSSTIGNVAWASMTCALDPSAAGTPQPYSDKTDINAVCRNSAGTLLLTADDFGLVRLFKYPASEPGQASKKLVGHASHVTNVRFTPDDRMAVSVGGNDLCVFQWKVEADPLQSDDSPDEFSDSDSDLARDIADPVDPRQTVRKGPTGATIDMYSKPATELVELQGETDADIGGGIGGGGGGASNAASSSSQSSVSGQQAHASRSIAAGRGGVDPYRYRDPRDPYANLMSMARPGDPPLHSRRARQRNFNAPAGGAGSQATQPPRERLELEFVHGVRTHDCYNNVFASAKGEIVYHAAAVGVVYDKRSHTQRHFEGHGDDILCLHMHPEGVLAATGEIGRDPKVIVWSTADCKPHAVLKGLHSRGVNCVAFNREGNRLASVGLDDHHTVAVWKWKTSDLIASSKGHGDKILSASWAPGDAYLVTCGVKHIKFWLLLGNQLSGGAGRFGSNGSIQTVIDTAFSPDGRCFTAVASGAIYEWTNATPQGSTKPAFKCSRVVVPEGGSGHTGPVFGLSETKTGFATGGKDGKICFWDANWRQTSVVKLPNVESHDRESSAPACVRSAAWADNAGTLVVAFKHGEIAECSERDCHPLLGGHAEGELWGLATHPTRSAYVTTSDDGSTRLWDVKTRKCVRVAHYKKPARAVGYSPDGSLVVTGHVDGSWQALDATTLEPVARKKHAREWIQDLKFSPDGALLAVSSHDNFIDIYDVRRSFKRIARCKGFSSFITHLDWTEDSRVIQAEDGAHEHLYFDAQTGKHITRSSQLAGAEWATWTCILGAPVAGIWGKNHSDNTDVNATCRNNSGNLLAVGDDSGDVLLFSYPATAGASQAPHHAYTTHSSHVTNVRFTADDAYLISAGGGDQCVMQWRVAK